MFIHKLGQYYHPNAELCIDEQLLEYHGRVRFRQYMASKPGKFGLKIFWLTDAVNSYALCGIPYIGKETINAIESSPNIPYAGRITVQLPQGFLDKGYNIATDNYFTSASLMEHLHARNTTYVGTYRRNRVELPSVATRTPKLPKGTTNYYRSDKILLVSYTDKKATQPVLLGTTKHRASSSDLHEKPEVINDYNKYKSGVDNLDHKLRIFSSKRKSCRWTMAFFFNMVDVALVNAHILFSQLVNRSKRANFLEKILVSGKYIVFIDGVIFQSSADLRKDW